MVLSNFAKDIGKNKNSSLNARNKRKDNLQRNCFL